MSDDKRSLAEIAYSLSLGGLNMESPRFDQLPEAQKRVQEITANGVQEAVMRKVFAVLEAKRDSWRMEGLAGNMARDDMSRAVARVSYNHANQIDELMEKLRSES